VLKLAVNKPPLGFEGRKW